MGATYQFDCSACGYQTQVSGGNDVGMACATTTILCSSCGELYDVVTSKEPWTADRWSDAVALRCPVEETHPVTRWRAPGPCPRCGVIIDRGALTILWD